MKPTQNHLLYEEADLRIIAGADESTQGQLLIITKDDYSSIEDIPDELLMKMMSLTQVCVSYLKNNYPLKGYSILQQGGRLNENEHFHLQIIPRFDEDSFRWFYSEEENAEARDFQQIKNLMAIGLSKKIR